VPFIQLDRQFVEWDDKDPAEAETVDFRRELTQDFH
jgi:hypothetical protein